MVSKEGQVLPEAVNDNPTPNGGDLLQHAQETVNQIPEIADEVEHTTVAVFRGLWSSFIPANEIDRLMQMREPANDNEVKKAA